MEVDRGPEALDELRLAAKRLGADAVILKRSLGSKKLSGTAIRWVNDSCRK